MNIVIDADDAAFDLKDVIVEHLENKGVSVTDLNFHSQKPDANYAEVGYNLANKIKNKENLQ